MIFLSKFIHVYANPLSTFAAAAIGSATVMWQARIGNNDLKGDLNHVKDDLNHVKHDLDHVKHDLDHVKTELHETKLHVEVIDTKLGIMNGNILSTMKAAGAAFKGNPTELNKLMARIEECGKSGGKGC